MAKVNICGLSEIFDPFYRYKREKIQISIQKNKTVLNNIEKISVDLERNCDLLIEYLKKKFETNIITKNNNYIINRNISSKEIDIAINEFTEYLVLCNKCGLPETLIQAEPNVVLVCKCCSYTGEIKKDKHIKNKAILRVIESLEKKNKKRKKRKNN